MKNLEVADLMTREVVSVVTSTSFKEVAKLLAQHDISGLPVLDDEDKVVGVVSESDILRHQVILHQQNTSGFVSSEMKVTAAQIMSVPAVTIHPHDTAAGAALLMTRNFIDRLPVVDHHDRIVGIVTRRDLLLLLLRPDSEIRRTVEQMLMETMKGEASKIDVHVLNGVVTLEGQLGDWRRGDILTHRAEAADGVVAVVNRMT
ncbi:CBS domain-containing protein [Streptomyces sp. NBC_01341]|uniref:CBS domain-containing protein n=1 Tax=Streptomyces sp. NBC_01341 TaxID=2903831 RepID=UPI002E0E9E7E|nr:CBS domain-containing protein [Streptomyces sp. NBC_01341]